MIGRNADMTKPSQTDEVAFRGIVTAVSELLHRKRQASFCDDRRLFEETGESAQFGDDWQDGITF